MFVAGRGAGYGAHTGCAEKGWRSRICLWNFITVAVNFFILAFIIFMMIRQINRLKREEPAAPAAPQPHLKTFCCARNPRQPQTSSAIGAQHCRVTSTSVRALCYRGRFY
jgi:heme/copper-type cytochrome/quinol oxidase subunit 3